MWPVHQSGRSSAVGRSLASSSRQGRASCFSLSLTARTPQANVGRRRNGSPMTSECLDSGCARRSECSSRRAQSRSSRRVVLASRPAIGSLCRPTYGQLCNPYLGSVMGNNHARNRSSATGNSVATKVEATHVGGSSELQSSHTCIAIIGQLADRCPCGEQAQGDLTSGARQHMPAHLTNQRGRVYYRLMTVEMAGCPRSPAGRRRRGGWADARGESSTRVKLARSINAAAAAGSR